VDRREGSEKTWERRAGKGVGEKERNREWREGQKTDGRKGME
jgi:hypothetical protein